MKDGFSYLKAAESREAAKETEKLALLSESYTDIHAALTERPDLKIFATRKPKRNETQIVPTQGQLYLAAEGEFTTGHGELRVRIGKDTYAIPPAEARQWQISPVDLIEVEHVRRQRLQKRETEKYQAPPVDEALRREREANNALKDLVKTIISDSHSVGYEKNNTVLVILTAAVNRRFASLKALVGQFDLGKIDDEANKILLRGSGAQTLFEEAMIYSDYEDHLKAFGRNNGRQIPSNFRLFFEMKGKNEITITASYEQR